MIDYVSIMHENTKDTYNIHRTSHTDNIQTFITGKSLGSHLEKIIGDHGELTSMVVSPKHLNKTITQEVITAEKSSEDLSARLPSDMKVVNSNALTFFGPFLSPESPNALSTMDTADICIAARRVIRDQLVNTSSSSVTLSNSGADDSELPVIYSIQGLSLFCPIHFDTELGWRLSYGLIDTGSGINIVRESFLKRLFDNRAVDIRLMKNQSLRVRVANSNVWNLSIKAVITYYIHDIPFTQEFWVSPLLREDILLGMPALSLQSRR